MQYLQLDPDYPEVWLLGGIAKKLAAGAVGVIPTDTIYAFVCDIGDRDAIERLCAVKQVDSKKLLSLLCKDLATISAYTKGIRNSHYRALRRCIPGPFTFIMPAGPLVPKLALHGGKRKEIGIRMPADTICIELLGQLERPLFSTSVKTSEDSFWNNPAEINEEYGKKLDFIVDGGVRIIEPSTVVDLTDEEPVVIRHGKGDATLFE